MAKTKKKNIKEICNEIDLIIAGKNNRTDYKYLIIHLDNALSQQISYDDIELICETIIKIAKTKSRILRHLEKGFWRCINNIPFLITYIQDLDINENEELLANTEYDNSSKKVLSRLIGLSQEILALKDDSSNGSDIRRAGSLGLIRELIEYYHIPNAKKLFVDSINSKNVNEQYTALEGLENYYSFSDDEIDDDIVQNLDRIKNETDDDTVASTCLQIQINAGLIDEMTALSEMDDWKDDLLL